VNAARLDGFEVVQWDEISILGAGLVVVDGVRRRMESRIFATLAAGGGG